MKEYKKPCSINIDNVDSERGIAPAAPALALMGAYAAGRAVKQVFEVNQTVKRQNYLNKVLVY